MCTILHTHARSHSSLSSNQMDGAIVKKLLSNFDSSVIDELVGTN